MKRLFFLVVAIILTFNLYANEIEKSNYVIFLFERISNGCTKEHDEFYWIVPEERISLNGLKISSLYMDCTSSFNRDRCLKGDTILWLNGREHDQGYENEVNKLLKIIESDKVLIQTIKTEWHQVKEYNKKAIDTQRYPDVVRVYAIPVKGVFCSCFQQHLYQYGNELRSEFEGTVYVPITGFESYKSYWKTKDSFIVKISNFVLFDFTRFTPKNYRMPERHMLKVMEKGCP